MDKIETVSRQLRKLLMFMAIAFPAVELIFWLFFHDLPEWVVNPTDLELIGIAEDNNVKRFACWAAGLPAYMVWIYMISISTSVLKNYENKKIFTLQNAVMYSKVGKSIFAFIILWFAANTAISIILSYHNSIIVNILNVCDPSYFMGIIISLGIILVSWVMKEAHRISDEQSKII